MLNISKNSINHRITLADFKAFDLLINRKANKWPIRFFAILMVLFIIAMFLPWTQNIQAKGVVTTQQPGQRPQAIQSVISGKVEEWYVREGEYVNKGDTILYISEVKDSYFDPDLIDRTAEQLDAKSQSVDSYGNKVRSLQMQYNALEEARDLKIAQTKNKIQQNKLKLRADSTDLRAMRTQKQIAEQQFNRTEELYNKGLKALTDFEQKKLKLQETTAKVVAQENKILAAINEIQNLELSLQTIRSEYADKMAKAMSDKFSAQTAQLDASASTSKLRNELSNYNYRQQFYYVTAPQNGIVTQSVTKGIGEIIKEGEDVVTIMPDNYELAVELYVKALDLPLLEIGQNVQLMFDGWPSITFRGWPNLATGTFQGEVMAIDQYTAESEYSKNNGKYRILVRPSSDPELRNVDWPKQLRVGSGSRAFILLKNVPVWYEIWRQLNGFPPNFYKSNTGNDDLKQKAPIRKVK